jgi:hypothetical protein
MKANTKATLDKLLSDNKLTAQYKSWIQAHGDYTFYPATITADALTLLFLEKHFYMQDVQPGVYSFNPDAQAIIIQIAGDNNNSQDFKNEIQKQANKINKPHQNTNNHINNLDVVLLNPVANDPFVTNAFLGYYLGETPMDAFIFSGGNTNAAAGAQLGNALANANIPEINSAPISNVIERGAKQLHSNGSALFSSTKNAATKGMEMVNDSARVIMDTGGNVVGQIVSGTEGATDTVFNAAGELLGTVKHGSLDAAGSAVEIGGKLIGTIADAASNIDGQAAASCCEAICTGLLAC